MATREKRRAALKRRTRGTEVEIDLRLDGNGRSSIETPFAPLNHLLELLVGHGGLDLKLLQTVNRHADDTYAIDDLATAFAEAYRRALGERPRIRQFGSEILPVGDALVLAAVDLISPPLFEFGVSFRSQRLDGMDVALIERFLATLTDRLGGCLHVRILAGNHDENKLRAIFLAVGRSLSQASVEVERQGAREIAADIDYLEGARPRPEAARGGVGGADEAVVEELEAEERLPEPLPERVPEREPERMPEGRRTLRGRRGPRRLPELPDVPGVPEEPQRQYVAEMRDVPELPDLPEFPEVSDEEEFEYPALDSRGSAPGEEIGSRAGRGTGEEPGGEMRRRRRGKRGGRGRHRSTERPPLARGSEPEELAGVGEEAQASRGEGEVAEADAGNGRGRLHDDEGRRRDERRVPGSSRPPRTGRRRSADIDREHPRERGRAADTVSRGEISRPEREISRPERDISRPEREPLPPLSPGPEGSSVSAHFGRGRRGRGRAGEDEPGAAPPPSSPAGAPLEGSEPAEGGRTSGSGDREVRDFVGRRERRATGKPHRRRR